MNMFEKLSPIYSEIVARTIAIAPLDWTRLWLQAECEEGSYSIGGYWEHKSTEDVTFFELPDEAEQLVWEAWKISCSYNDHWSTAVFRVDRPDKLSITFGHEDLDDDAYSSAESQAAFRAQTFGTRRIDDSSIDMSGALSLTPGIVKAGLLEPRT